ncbi:hypothetical protein ACFVP8_17135 [Viridibacillus arvi]|uniref:hypothetical protein n=1 Tax=Viridibacillus arvi TaxID=263475 RepID=UPI0036954362
MAIFSVVSDNLPRIENLTIIQKVLLYLATMLNSLPMGFITAMFVGYYFAINLRQAALFGLLYTLFSISLYLFIFYFYESIPKNLSISIMQRVMG